MTMRLIDADALLKSIHMEQEAVGADLSVEAIEAWIELRAENAPDAVPVKPLAEWLAGYAFPPELKARKIVASRGRGIHEIAAEGWEAFLRGMDWEEDKAREIIEDAPTEVVTCQDCKYFAIKDYWGDFNGHPILATSDAPTCTKWGTGDCLTRPDGFCFLAERREADDETD